jgi:hypothetical protein
VISAVIVLADLNVALLDRLAEADDAALPHCLAQQLGAPFGKLLLVFHCCFSFPRRALVRCAKSSGGGGRVIS